MKGCIAALLVASTACNAAGEGSDGSVCGPTSAVVTRVIDGDTVELEGGERVRYLLVDTPEISTGPDCFGPEAAELNRMLVEGQSVVLHYDEAECEDHFGRLLAFVEVQGRSVNRLLIERGMACVLYIPPGGEDQLDDYQDAEATARATMVGMWGSCEEVACD